MLTRFYRKGTNRVTIDEMVRHCRAVTNVKHCFTPFIVGDLPFSAYLTSEVSSSTLFAFDFNSILTYDLLPR